MATYKKRGYRKPKEKVQEVAFDENLNEVEGYEEGASTTEEIFENLDEGANKIEEWVAENQKMIFIVIGVITLGILLYMGYNKFIQEPKEADAANAAYVAQDYFAKAVNATGKEQDSLFNLALNGADGKQGLLFIAKEYSSTKAGNLATYAAGIAYLNMNDYKNAVSYLDNFTSEDEIFSASAKGAIGDAYVQLNQLEDALAEYQKAIKLTTNSYTTPKFLYKAAVVALDLGKNDLAEKYLTQIKKDYATSLEANKVEALLGKAQAK